MAKDTPLPPTTVKRIVKNMTNMLFTEKAVLRIIFYTLQFLKKLTKLAKSYATVAKKKTITAEMIDQAMENM